MEKMKDIYCFAAVLEKGESGEYGVYFPDLPGCVSGGESVEEAMRSAKEALLLHLYGMEEDGENIPEPSEPEAIKHAENEFVFLVEANYKVYKGMMKRQRKTCTLTIPAALYTAAKESGLNMSQVFQDALREQLGLS